MSPPSSRPRHGLGGLRIARLAGIDLFAHWSLFIAFLVITIDLGAIALPAWHPEWNAALRWTVAIAAAILFWASLTAHELAHAVVARRNGLRVRGITLFALGGMSQIEGEPSSPSIELRVALAGPAVSLMIGVVALFAGAATTPSPVGDEPLGIMRAASPLTTLLLWLGPANVIIGLFNLIPGFPLDGGRALRAILWGATADLGRATRWSSTIGQIVGWGLFLIGAIGAFTGLGANGLWLVLIGWFVANAARASRHELVVRAALENVPVGALVHPGIDTVAPETTLDVFIRDRFLPSSQQVFPVVIDGHLIGMITLDDVRRVARELWPTTPVVQVMQPIATWPTLAPADDALEALPALAEREQVPVVDSGRFVGLAYLSDVVKRMALAPPGRGNADAGSARM